MVKQRRGRNSFYDAWLASQNDKDGAEQTALPEFQAPRKHDDIAALAELHNSNIPGIKELLEAMRLPPKAWGSSPASLDHVDPDIYHKRPWLKNSRLVVLSESNPFEFLLRIQPDGKGSILAYDFVLDEVLLLSSTISYAPEVWLNGNPDNWMLLDDFDGSIVERRGEAREAIESFFALDTNERSEVQL